jgi:hypothetical protein
MWTMSRTARSDPKRPTPRMLSVDERRAIFRRLMEDPKCRKSKTATELPNRWKLRRLKELPT